MFSQSNIGFDDHKAHSSTFIIEAALEENLVIPQEFIAFREIGLVSGKSYFLLTQFLFVFLLFQTSHSDVHANVTQGK